MHPPQQPYPPGQPQWQPGQPGQQWPGQPQQGQPHSWQPGPQGQPQPQPQQWPPAPPAQPQQWPPAQPYPPQQGPGYGPQPTAPYPQSGQPLGWQQTTPIGQPGWSPGPPPRKSGKGVAIAAVVGVVGVLALLGGLVVLLNGENKPIASSPTTSASITPSRSAEAEPTRTAAGSIEDPEPTSTSPARDGGEALFLTTMRQRYDLKDKSEAELLKLGRDICRAMDNGRSLIQAALDHADELGAERAGYVAGAAAVGLCPEHRDKVPS
ncbi:DUF732 domain-containing protein [Streptosporangium sp. NPDC051022]|uniref:DUF732 domain-containing protein n=1 Tax=Streptosporangium sp. NPDC051022 TaxID=3155752 RepID=UPI003422F6F4